MNDARIKVYTTRICGYCVAAKRLLERDGIPYEEIDLSADPSLRWRLVDETGWRTVPIIMLDGELVGGYQELAQMRSAGGLSELLP